MDSALPPHANGRGGNSTPLLRKAYSICLAPGAKPLPRDAEKCHLIESFLCKLKGFKRIAMRAARQARVLKPSSISPLRS
jgi:hypothetical protein